MALCMAPSVAHTIRLVDTKIRSLKPAGKLYKVTDRDGLCVAVTAGGGISFRYNYRINDCQETLTIGAYGIGGIALAAARENQLTAKKLVQEGISPVREKIRTKSHDGADGTSGKWAEKWIKGHWMADNTRDMRHSVDERDLQGRFGKLHKVPPSRLLESIGPGHHDTRITSTAYDQRAGRKT